MRNPILAAALGAAVMYLWGRLLDWYRVDPERDAIDHLAKRDRIR